jgi:tRNA-modifying protein YgfZ
LASGGLAPPLVTSSGSTVIHTKFCQKQPAAALRAPAPIGVLVYTALDSPSVTLMMTTLYWPLPDRACIEVRGRDATAFLHGQLSRTISALPEGRAPLAAWLDARGRVRALFRVLRLDDSWLLITERDNAHAALKKLGMFILRAAVTMTPNDELCVAAVVDAEDSWRGAAAPPDTVMRHDSLHWIRVGHGLWHVVGPAADVEAGTPKRGMESRATSLPKLAEIRLGIPAITAALADRYVPQMLNLDRLDAVSFDKGCYPGQEVVARVHNMGSVKRRMRRYASDSAAVPRVGDELRTATQAVGEIIAVAVAPGGSEMLAVVEHAAVGADLTIGEARLRELPLPYPVPRE